VLLAHQFVQQEGSTPKRWVVFLHGVLGRGTNWLGFARKLVAAQPQLGALWSDLRMHGDSQALPPPHTFDAVARDVLSLLDATLGTPVLAVVGHSFGGKVALKLRQLRPGVAAQAWVLDASPSARRGRGALETTQSVFDALRTLPKTFESRNAFARALTETGVAPGLGLWLAKNLVRDPDNARLLRFGLDLDAIAELLADHDRQDLWPIVESSGPGASLGFVLGGRSTTVSQADRGRLATLATDRRIELSELAEAGHWLHTDDPEGLLSLLEHKLADN